MENDNAIDDDPYSTPNYELHPLGDLVHRHISTRHFEPLFRFGHLREGDLREVSEHCANLAGTMISMLPDGPEFTAGLRKLLEAKDCFVRTAVLELEKVPKAAE